MDRGALIIFDGKGRVLANTGESTGNVAEHTIPQLPINFVVLDYGQLDRVADFKINASTKKIEVLKRFEITKTYDELKTELQNAQLEILMSKGVI